jgi:uncharacterized protein YbbK (DUF523 family)
MKTDSQKVILISGCLIGLSCDYRGRKKPIHPLIDQLLHQENIQVIPFCPEQLGGMTTPRNPSEIINGTGADVWQNKAILTSDLGNDVTTQFTRGATEALYLAELYKPDLIITKERSPSCGVHFISDGSFSGAIRPGEGVAVALLASKGYTIISEEEITEKKINELLF